MEEEFHYAALTGGLNKDEIPRPADLASALTAGEPIDPEVEEAGDKPGTLQAGGDAV